jgi:hypothetical protein
MITYTNNTFYMFSVFYEFPNVYYKSSSIYNKYDWEIISSLINNSIYVKKWLNINININIIIGYIKEGILIIDKKSKFPIYFINYKDNSIYFIQFKQDLLFYNNFKIMLNYINNLEISEYFIFI